MEIKKINICPQTLSVHMQIGDQERTGILTKRTPTTTGYQLHINIEGTPTLKLFEEVTKEGRKKIQYQK